MSSSSIWYENAPDIKRAALSRDATTEVCIVGAGIAGLTIGYLLARAGKEVTIVDKDCIGEGETLRTSAHLASVLDYRIHEIAGIHGNHAARAVVMSHATAIDTIEEIAAREGIDCQFLRVPGFLYPATDTAEDRVGETLDKEFEAARTAGLDVSRVSEAPLLRTSRPALRFERQAQFDVALYIGGLVKAFEAAGGTLHCGTNVTSVETKNNLRLRSDAGGAITAKHLVFASSTPFNDMFAIHTKQTPYRSYVAAFPYTGPWNPALLWDTEDPYHFVRLLQSNGKAYLLAGGEDHKTGQAPDHEQVRRLEEWTARNFNIAGKAEYFWSGQVLEPIDKLAFIGRNPSDNQNVYIVTGTSGNGLTYGTIAGLLLSELIQGRENPWAALYDPSRITLSTTPEFVAANANVMAQYTDWVTPGQKSDPEEIRPGTGATVREGASKVAVYRTPSGDFVRLSAVCPHLGCLVGWNNQEKTWDCPCHGSRFTPEGKVINGPASHPLEEVQAEEAAPPVAMRPA